MDYESSSHFITPILEWKLDLNTMLKWHQDSTDAPHYLELLDFNNVRGQTSVLSISNKRTPKDNGHIKEKVSGSGKLVTSFKASAMGTEPI